MSDVYNPRPNEFHKLCPEFASLRCVKTHVVVNSVQSFLLGMMILTSLNHPSFSKKKKWQKPGDLDRLIGTMPRHPMT